ncbi:hypothetical protein [Nioella sediminis]|uniref:hypothetical protein n=1 Tax=Nioella sediminis TaxID=1912092 RepID=UPI0008FD0C7B|nr:hypothetical protein [Nioella sediminis]TBX29197.1 hypothetical protein TK43_01710 [Roseovarius sp. JS7-11]
MTACPPYAPARIWAVHGLGFLAGLGAMAGVFWLLLADFLSDQVKAGPLVGALLLAVVAGAGVWAGALKLWLGRRWLSLAGIAALALLLAGGGVMGAVIGLQTDPATSGLVALGALFLAGGVILGGMGGEA